MECVFKGRHGEKEFHGVLMMHRKMACLVMAGTLGVCSGYGQVAGKDGSQKSVEPKKAVVGSELPVTEPSQKADKPNPSGVAKPAIKPTVALPDAKPVKNLTGKFIVLDEGFEGVLPENLGDYKVEINDLTLGKLLGIVKARTVVLKEDVGTVRIGQILLDGSALSSLVDALPDVVEGVEVKKVSGPMGAMTIIGRAIPARKNGSGAGHMSGDVMAGVMAVPLPTPTQESQVIPVNLSSYLGTAKESEKDRKIKDLRETIEMAFIMKAKGDGKKAGKVEILVHGATELGFLSGTPQDLAFAMMVLQALGIKTPAVSTQSHSVDLTGPGSLGSQYIPRDYRVSPGQGVKIPMVSGISNNGAMMNPPIAAVSGHALPGTNGMLNPQEMLPILKKNQEQIAALEGTIRRLEQELENAKKGAGK